MSDTEIRDLAIETYELGIKMAHVFTGDKNNKDYMVMAIYACISTAINKSSNKRYGLNPVIEFNGEYFQKLRKEKNYTIRQVEDATGISNSYLSQFENGKIVKPSHSVITKLINFYETGIVIVEHTEFEPKGTLLP